MNEKIIRVGTTYIPVRDISRSSSWYVSNLGAELSYKDEDKVILNFANQSFFLVRAKETETANFYDYSGQERFSLTFEVNGLSALEEVHREFVKRGMKVGDIEDRGHAGRNFVFRDPDGNLFDIWSELSPEFKDRFNI
ncbi:VOC family protein [Cytobacillus praedii]|uniref:VOC family protein n=1 Tax=Cytobacillus praedii TaxID=1742358 RepID=A0A4R1AUA6_9BACI|nr:VOC family protein [Cytobacillus praedii]TCJ03721.1 VOC family protein [Cytobacillus praedii]